MKFTAVSTALVAAAVANAAMVPNETPECHTDSISINYERPFVRPLVEACRDSLGSSAAEFNNPYRSRLCVAAAVAAGPQTFRNLLSCKNPLVTPETGFAPLDRNVFASIAGGCAECDVTRQNLVDLIYSQVGVEANPVYPESATDLAAYYIDTIFKWTATAPDHTAYGNFNDWLHYAGRVTPEHCLGCGPA